MLKKKYFSVPSIVIFSYGVIIGGSILVYFGQFFVNIFDYNFLYFSILAWLFIRIVNLLYQKLIQRNEQAISFALAYFLPILSILLLGFFKIKLSIHLLAIFGFLDMLIFTFYNISTNLKQSLKMIFLGIIFVWVTSLISVIQHFPWLPISSSAGIGFIDDFRDAAIAQSWDNYSAISHGIHGLLFHPYHSLSVFFSTPFINNEISIFEFFTYFSLIVIPSIFSYGIWMMLNITCAENNRPYLIIIYISFFILFIGFEYVFNQRSVQIASLLYISAIPLLISILSAPEKKIVAFAFIAILVPLILFARPHHGLILAISFYTLILIVKTNLLEKFIILISSMLSLLIILIFYSGNSRTGDLNFANIILSTVQNYPYLIDPINLIYFFIFVTVLLVKQRKNFFHTIQSNSSRAGIIILLLIASGFAITIKSKGTSDIFYMFLPVFFISYVIFFSKIFSQLLPTINGKINIKFSENIIELEIKKFFIMLIVYISLIFCVTEYSKSLNDRASGYKDEIMNWRKLAGFWNYDGGNQILIDNLDNNTECKSFDKFDVFCKLRVRIFGFADFNEATQNSLPARMAKKALKLIASSKGVTAIYVSPDHEYWSIDYFSREYTSHSIYFMAQHGIPMIAGANPKKITHKVSYLTAKANEGTLLTIKELGGVTGICKIAKKVGVSNVIAFNSNDVEANFYNCKKINSND